MTAADEAGDTDEAPAEVEPAAAPSPAPAEALPDTSCLAPKHRQLARALRASARALD
jgi:hypothetical protein